MRHARGENESPERGNHLIKVTQTRGSARMGTGSECHAPDSSAPASKIQSPMVESGQILNKLVAPIPFKTGSGTCPRSHSSGAPHCQVPRSTPAGLKQETGGKKKSQQFNGSSLEWEKGSLNGRHTPKNSGATERMRDLEAI